MSKIPGQHHHTRLPQVPKGPHKAHEAKRKTNASQTSDPASVEVDVPVDSLDRSRAIGEASSGGQGGFGERAPHDPKAAVSEEPLPERRAIDRSDSLAVVLDEIKVRLERLATGAQGQESGPLSAPASERGRVIPRAETVAELRDLLRQTLSGDFGFTLANTPQITFSALFSRVTVWPEELPPRHDWDALLAWVMAPPAMPTDLLKF